MGRHKNPPKVKVAKKKGPQLTALQCQSIVTSREYGTTLEDIGEKFHVTKSAIYKVLKKYKTNDVIGRKAGSGRKRITTTKQDHRILREVKKDRKVSGKQINESLGLANISKRTIRRRITESGEFKSYWAAKKPFINYINRQRRLQWCKRYQNMTSEDWMNYLFSDESPYVLRYKSKVRVWRRHNERYSPLCTVATVKHDVQIMVWGCFCGHGLGNLYQVEGIMEQV